MQRKWLEADAPADTPWRPHRMSLPGQASQRGGSPCQRPAPGPPPGKSPAPGRRMQALGAPPPAPAGGPGPYPCTEQRPERRNPPPEAPPAGTGPGQNHPPRFCHGEREKRRPAPSAPPSAPERPGAPGPWRWVRGGPARSPDRLARSRRQCAPGCLCNGTSLLAP